MAERRHVYLIRFGDLHKVGWSRSPEGRAKGLIGKGPLVVHSFPCARGCVRAVERRLHDWLDAGRVRGEWFRIADEAVALIRSITACRSLDDLPPAIRDAPAAPYRRCGASGFRTGKGIYIELPPALVDRVKGLAERNRRGFKDEIQHAIERHLEAPPEVTVKVEVPPLGPAALPDPPPKPKRGRPKKPPAGE